MAGNLHQLPYLKLNRSIVHSVSPSVMICLIKYMTSGPIFLLKVKALTALSIANLTRNAAFFSVFRITFHNFTHRYFPQFYLHKEAPFRFMRIRLNIFFPSIYMPPDREYPSGA